MEDKLSRKIRAYVNGEAGAEIFDTRDRRHIRVLLKEHQRKQEWLRDKLPCPQCHGTGLETVANPDDAPIVKNGRGYRMAYCLHCHGMRYVTIAQAASGEVLGRQGGCVQFSYAKNGCKYICRAIDFAYARYQACPVAPEKSR